VLFAHPEFMPKKYRDRVWFFWATIFSDSVGNLCVRCLFWGGRQWDRRCRWLCRGWRGRNPSASLANQTSKLEPQPS